MREDNQAAILGTLLGALVAGIISIIVVLIKNRESEQREARQEARHDRELKEAAKNAETHEIKALGAVNRSQEAEIHALQEQVKHLITIGDGVQSLLYEKLHKIHSAMIARGGVCPDDEKKVAERIYNNYHELGGNGVGTAWYKDILNAHSEQKVVRKEEHDS